MKKWSSLLVVAGILVAAPNLWAQCVAVSSATATLNTGGNTAITFSATSGNTIVVSLTSIYSGATPVVKSNLATFTPDANSTADTGNGTQTLISHLFNVGGGTTSVTINNGGNGGAATVFQFSGGSNVVDKTLGNGGSAASKATWSPPPSGTLSQASEIIISAAGTVGGEQTLSSGPSSGYTPISFFSGDTNDTLASAFTIVNATTTSQTAWIIAGSKAYSSAAVTYECNSAAAPSTGAQVILIKNSPSPEPEEVMQVSSEAVE